ncbi:uncharacterized protein [Mytilus edulis]|uniref:uncharacterized protein n=1 Tax=Mytilus edulis TaxID=6550 RepID=UPI0039F109FA
MFRITCKILFSTFLIFLVNTEVSGLRIACRLKCPPVPYGLSHCGILCKPHSCDRGYLCCSIGCGKECRKGIRTCR